MSGGDPWVPGIVIDVSKWQAALPSLTGVLGVIARAGIGTKPDALFAEHITNARKAGKWVGSYWFNWGSLSVSDQVDAYITMERSVGGVSLHVIDWEGADGFTATQTAQFISLYRQRTGNLIGLYASEGRFRDLGQDWNWIANYSQEPVKAYDMWQYGPFRGVDGNHATQRILDLVQESTSVGPTVINVQPFSGIATVKSDGAQHGAIAADDGQITWLPAGAQKPVVSKGIITPAWAGHPSGVVYMCGDEAAWLLAEDITVTATPDTTPYSKADLDAAAAAAAAAQKAADQAALDAAAAALQKAQADLAAAPGKERERIAVALGEDEANKVRSA